MLAAISESESLASSVATENVEHGERMEFLLAESVQRTWAERWSRADMAQAGGADGAADVHVEATERGEAGGGIQLALIRDSDEKRAAGVEERPEASQGGSGTVTRRKPSQGR